MEKLFINEAATPNNPKWENMISRREQLYKRDNELRSEFERDYTRVIHSTAYRRLKHKTQVFFSPTNDHISTRIEHVNYVESISNTISNALGLNTELTRAIAVAHDLGHSPFGHQGEKVLSEISKRDFGESFWHEKNGLNIVDNIETLEDNYGEKRNLNLTYAVRDGIISHCGEIDENNIKPREEFIDLTEYKTPNQFAPYTWEGCVVKISDKISYLGRDIEDAITLGILDEHLEELYELLQIPTDIKINNTVIINDLIHDLCLNSSPEKGLTFSDKYLNLINGIKEFNYKNIYFVDRLEPSKKYFNIVLNQIYDILKKAYDGENTKNNLEKMTKFYPSLCRWFVDWLESYSNSTDRFDINNLQDYCRAILYYISGMTDNFAINMYNEIIGF